MHKLLMANLLGTTLLAMTARFSPADDVGSQAVENFDLDASLDDIEDLPEFVVFPSGAVVLDIESWEQKKINDKDAIVIHTKFDEALEWTEEGPYPNKGDMMDISFMLNNKFGLGKMKQFLNPIKAKFGTTSTRNTLEAIVSGKLVVAGKREPATEKLADGTKRVVPDKFYYRVKNVMVP